MSIKSKEYIEKLKGGRSIFFLLARFKFSSKDDGLIKVVFSNQDLDELEKLLKDRKKDQFLEYNFEKFIIDKALRFEI